MSKNERYALFNKYVEFFEKSHLQEETGGYAIALSKTHHAWGRLRPIMPNVKSTQLHPTKHPWTHRLVTRYFSGLYSGQVAKIEGRKFNIDHVINSEEEDAYLELMLIEEKKDEKIIVN
jgi:hypothetical protein